MENKEDIIDEILMYIMENINRDVIVFCGFMKKVVVVDKVGKYRFEYRGYCFNINFLFMGICMDVFGYILVYSSDGYLFNI